MKPIVGFPGYLVDEEGNVYSTWARGSKASPRKEPKKRRLSLGRGRYPGVLLRRGGRTHFKRIHGLVLEAFRGERPKGKLGLHKDDNPMNNRLSNLYWGTPSQNYYDRMRNSPT